LNVHEGDTDQVGEITKLGMLFNLGYSQNERFNQTVQVN